MPIFLFSFQTLVEGDEKLKSSPTEEDCIAAVFPGTMAEREIRKWSEADEWPDNPYTQENVEKRKHLNMFLESIQTEQGKDEMTEDQKEENLCALPYITPSKDLNRFRRDYYIPDSNHKDETFNGFEEKVS